MTVHEKTSAYRMIVSELQEAQTRAALCVARLQELVGADGFASRNKQVLPVIEDASFTVHWRCRHCHLGCTASFRILALFLRRLNHYVRYQDLINAVWGEQIVSPATVRSAIRQLRDKLRSSGMRKLASSIHGEGHHYGLILRRH